MQVEDYEYNPLVEKIVRILMERTQNYNPHFFRTQTNFYLSLIPSSLQISIDSPITTRIPINFYSVSLMNSGFGKGLSTSILENEVINLFKDDFTKNVFKFKSDMSLQEEALARAARLDITLEEATTKLHKEFNSYGSFQFYNSEGTTTAAIKQMRNKILLAGLGSINIFIDEIGLNLGKSEEALTTLLEMYDKGFIKNKLTKSTETNTRFEELTGSTPANLNIFGSPTKLLNGDKTEELFFSLLETGYSRRCFFCYSDKKAKEESLTAEELYNILASPSNQGELKTIALMLKDKADGNYIGNTLTVPKEVGIELIRYRQWCEERANKLPDYAEIQRAELVHRYFKALKLAGTYAFLDGKGEVLIEHLHQAIKFAEDSGMAMNKLFNRQKPYERLAMFIAGNKGKELTQVDLQNELPFYKGSKAVKDEMMCNAVAWGYKNNIIIKKYSRDGIEFISGESLKPTDLSTVIIAYSQHWSSDYKNANGKEDKAISFNGLQTLVKLDGYHWINHYSRNGNRTKEDMIQGFNLLVLDIDSEVELKEARLLLENYTYLIHTTKRHQSIDPQTGKQYGDRFRIILPMNYIVKLSYEEYREFMKNIADWLPFSGLDEQTFQPNRKWSTYPNAEVYVNEGELIDVTPFIPRTSRNEEYRKHIESLGSMENIERWFATRIDTIGRNNTLIKYGLMLLDAGIALNTAKEKILSFNSKLREPLEEKEIYDTIFKTMEKH